MPDDVKLPEWIMLWANFIIRMAYHFFGGFSMLLLFLQIPMIKGHFNPATFEKINVVVIGMLSVCIVISGGKGLHQLQKLFNNGKQ